MSNVLNKLAKLLYKEFCKTYGKIIDLDAVYQFLNQVDDLREVNQNYVYYLYDYVMDNDIWG